MKYSLKSVSPNAKLTSQQKQRRMSVHDIKFHVDNVDAKIKKSTFRETTNIQPNGQISSTHFEKGDYKKILL